MEIGDYLTNVLSINDLSSIQYYYLQLSSSSKPEPTRLWEIEAAWRRSGALVVHYKSGIWVFGKGGELEQILPQTATIKADGFVEFHDDVLAIRHQGALDPSNVWKATKYLVTTSSTAASATSPPSSTDSNIRNIQSLNAKASYSNSIIGVKRESGTGSSPVQDDSTVFESAFEGRDIQEQFISAVLATLSYHLCHDDGFIALNARTLVLPSSDYFKVGQDGSETTGGAIYRERIWLITLDVQLTSLGTLLVKAWPNAPFHFSWTLNPRQGLAVSDSLLDGTTLFLAPSGKVGRYCGPSILGASSMMLDDVGTPMENHPHGSLFPEQPMMIWKQRCISWLVSKGIEVTTLESGAWFTVQVRSQSNDSSPINAGEDDAWSPKGKLVTILWPAELCFKRITSDTDNDPVTKTSHGHDPLLFAGGWYSVRAIREATMAKRRKERESDAAVVQAQADADARNLASNNFSPAGLRRASLAGAVYPTPPDGIQPAVGATPSFDGNGSTPGQPNPQNLALEPEIVAIPKSEPEDADSNLWDSGEAKRDHTISSALDFNDNENDNLFGDLAGDLFGENDITDADFSFFDAPDPVESMEDNATNKENSFEDTKEHAADYKALGDAPLKRTLSSAELDVVMTEPSFDENGGNEDGEPSAEHDVQMEMSLNPEQNSSRSPKHVYTRKSPSPPLSPGLIFKKLSTTGASSGETKGLKSLDRAIGSFSGVPFDHALSSFNNKYGASGRFMYPSGSKTAGQPVLKSLPSTGYLNKIKKRKPNVVKIFSQAFISTDDTLDSELDHNENASETESAIYSHPASPISDQDDTSTSTGDGPLVFSPGLKRKRGSKETEDDNDEMTSSFQELKVDYTRYFQGLDPLDLLNDNLLDADPADWSLTSFLSSPEPRHFTGSLGDAEYIASAQVLADQAISQTLEIPLLTDRVADDYANNGIDGNSIKILVQQKLSHAAKSCFNRATECTMTAFVDTQDSHQNGPGNRIASRPTPISRVPQISEPTKPSLIFNLPAPHLEVQRSESKLTVLPPAIPFWENLGLAPCRGGKDVNAICIYPDGEGVAESIEAFLEQIRNAYESSRLGSHERFSHADLIDGHVPMNFGDSALLSVADHQAILSKIQETSTRVGISLAGGSVSETNLVIYYVYDSDSPELLVPICSAFHDLFEAYKESLDNEKLPVSNELVFQLVPMNFIASKDSLIVPPPTEYTRLAMEVYDRCVDLNTGTSVPSIILEQPLPRVIDFKLTPNPSASPLQENSCMHVAYAQSLDDRWITAAWTDNTGTQQMTASYCLGRRNSPLTTSFNDIAREIWETTMGIIAIRNVNWRILVAKSGVMDPPEIAFWQSLASESHQSIASKESNTQITLTLITVDTNPSLELLPSSISVAPNILAAQSSVYTTPVSTPQASIFSPEPGSVGTPTRDPAPANAPTPNDSNTELKIDADATLIDITDQTWGAILSHRLNNSRSLLEFNPTLISGYLIKRSGATPSDIPAVIAVNIVHSEVYPRMLDTLLREILGLYRGFATLARVRGCVDPVKDGRPWHIAAAEKGVQALYMLM